MLFFFLNSAFQVSMLLPYKVETKYKTMATPNVVSILLILRFD